MASSTVPPTRTEVPMILSGEQLPASPGSRPGWVRVEDGVIAQVGGGAPPSEAAWHAAYLLPGLVDQHCHGGGGASFATTDAEEARRAAATHLTSGTTTLMASLVTAPVETLVAQIRTLAPLVDEGVIGGIHLEGPWLSPLHRGAHDPELLHPPSPEEVSAVLDAADGRLAMVTLAPELDGSPEAISRLVDAEVVVAVGHTDCDADGLRRAVDAGARVVTHLCNAMRPMHHRDPGPVVAAVGDDRLTVELIVDGIHIHPDVVDLLARSARAQVALVTDAMSAAGLGDGEYLLGRLVVDVVAGVARLSGGASIAGSTLTMDRALRTAVAVGVPLQRAVAGATSVPARAMGWAAGSLEVGSRADVLLLDEALRPVGVWAGGEAVGAS